MPGKRNKKKGSGQRWKLQLEGGVCSCFRHEIKQWWTLMQAKSPLASHANLMPRRSGWVGEIVNLVKDGGGENIRQVHSVHWIATMTPRKLHTNTQCSSIGCSWIRESVHIFSSFFCPLWLSSKEEKKNALCYVKHANLIELMTWVLLVSAVFEGSLSNFSFFSAPPTVGKWKKNIVAQFFSSKP